MAEPEKKGPPWRLDPLQIIINVGWSDYRLVAIVVGASGAPEIKMAFTTPKTSYPVTENMETPAPAFGSKISLPSDTKPLSVVGEDDPYDNRLAVTGPQIKIDYRGYVELAVQHWVGGTAVPTGQKIYYDHKGKPIGAAKIPKASRRGAPIASDKQGTVYVHGAGPGGGGAITKYDDKGRELWRLDGAPLAANYDKETKQIIATGYPTSQEISLIDPNNGRLSTEDILGLQVTDASREGKIYGSTGATGTNNPGIKGLDRDGNPLFEIPGPLFGQGFYGGPIAYGEDYILVTKSVDSSTFGFTGDLETGIVTTSEQMTDYYVLVFDAKTGGSASQTHWGRNKITNVIYTGLGPQPPDTITQESWGSVGVVRSQYFPPQPETLP